jgi:hypothetical protein
VVAAVAVIAPMVMSTAVWIAMRALIGVYLRRTWSRCVEQLERTLRATIPGPEVWQD